MNLMTHHCESSSRRWSRFLPLASETHRTPHRGFLEPDWARGLELVGMRSPRRFKIPVFKCQSATSYFNLKNEQPEIAHYVLFLFPYFVYSLYLFCLIYATKDNFLFNSSSTSSKKNQYQWQQIKYNKFWRKLSFSGFVFFFPKT